MSLGKFVCDKTKETNNTIADWAFKMLSENKLYEAHQQLKKVWGIGDKIASFYLRDIYWLGSELSPAGRLINIDNIYLIQPIDIWVKRAAEAMGCENKSRKEIAKYISSFEQELRLSPGGGNIALWMLGSKYVDNIEEFDNLISALICNSEESKEIALKIADYFIYYYGKFGRILKENLV